MVQLGAASGGQSPGRFGELGPLPPPHSLPITTGRRVLGPGPAATWGRAKSLLRRLLCASLSSTHERTVAIPPQAVTTKTSLGVAQWPLGDKTAPG